MKTHYDVLELDKNCSSEEIKKSYIRLSKKYHPDVNDSADAQKKFIRLNEAYSILGKSDSRNKYDESLMMNRIRNQTAGRYYHEVSPQMAYYTYYYANRNNFEHHPNLKSPKTKVLGFLCCCFLMMVGSGIQLAAEYRRALKRSGKTAMINSQARTKAMNTERKLTLKDFEADVK